MLFGLIKYKSLIYKALFVFISFFVFSSCWNPTFKGYTQTDSGLYYKLITIGDGKKKPSFGDFLQLRITYKTEKDSVFLDTYSSNFTGMVILPFNHSSFRGSFEEGLTTMNEGDSVSFIVDANSLFNSFFKAKLPFFLKPGDLVKMDVKLNKILNPEEYSETLKKYEDQLDDRDIEEQRGLKLFLDTCQTRFSAMASGIFYLPVSQGTGENAKTGDKVKINYKGYFLDGRQFESTYERGQPLEFRLGEQEQVIKGIEKAISCMNEGAKTKFIIPSHLAFGDSGSSTGIIPPYSTLIYEIELLNIN
jgi:FKBP-type peptidyl-prolyl cis-trans isomerase FkpA